jgi:hypothetical protein
MRPRREDWLGHLENPFPSHSPKGNQGMLRAENNYEHEQSKADFGSFLCRHTSSASGDLDGENLIKRVVIA